MACPVFCGLQQKPMATYRLLPLALLAFWSPPLTAQALRVRGTLRSASLP